MVASAVFSQPPIGVVGLSEADARHIHGKVDIYLAKFRAMKETFYGGTQRCLMKLVVEQGTEKILGCHVVAPDGPEIIQNEEHIPVPCGAGGGCASVIAPSQVFRRAVGMRWIRTARAAAQRSPRRRQPRRSRAR